RFTNERPIFDGVYYAVKSALSGGDSRREVKLGASRPAVVMPPEPPKPVQMTLPLQKAQPTQSQPSRPEVIQPPKEKSEQRVIFSDIVPVASGMEIVNDPGIESIAPPPAYPSGRKWTNINISADFDEDVTSTQETAQTLSDDAYLFGNATDKAEEIIAAEQMPDAAEPIISENVTDEPQSASPDASEAVQKREGEEESNPFEMPSYRIIGEAFETYIMIESGDELILIDKHAAHERLIYERLVAQKSGREAQLLLEPLVITLDKQQYDVLLSNRDMMQEGGFEIEDFGFGAILIRSVPTVLADGDIEGAVMEIADNIGVKKDALMTRRMEDMYHTIACRSAIKAHDRSLEAEMEALVSQLIANPEVRYCPHGRPIYISLKKREIEKNFGRV
ncbi:MAG: hypothetical protein IJP17_05855, partial [Clostridia bacterium]|nr:hypothetical protein [Clostridia bacterium]